MLKKRPFIFKFSWLCVAIIAFAVVKMVGLATLSSAFSLETAFNSSHILTDKNAPQLVISETDQASFFSLLAEIIEESENEEQQKKRTWVLTFLLLMLVSFAKKITKKNTPISWQRFRIFRQSNAAYIDFCSLKIPF